MPNETEFKEVGRVDGFGESKVVVSEVWNGGELKGFSVNKYVVSDKYTGFAKGTLIPEESLQEFADILTRLCLEREK